MSRRDRTNGFDPQRVLMAAVEAFLAGESGARPRAPAEERSARRHVSGGSVMLGVGIGIGARSLYHRVRALDLEQVARAVERRLVN
jgi:hypothetical protein